MSLGLSLCSHFHQCTPEGAEGHTCGELLHMLVCYYMTFHFPQDEEVEEHTSYSVVRVGYESTVLLHLCDTVRRMLEHIDWSLLRLQAEYVAMTHSVSDRLQASKCYHLNSSIGTYGM